MWSTKAKIIGLALLTSGCANATRTIPVPVIEHQTMPSFDTEGITERKRLSVPQDRSYLPPPVEAAPLPPVPQRPERSKPYQDPVLRDIQRNNYNSGFKPNVPRS